MKALIKLSLAALAGYLAYRWIKKDFNSNNSTKDLNSDDLAIDWFDDWDN
jgi:hypothetical protein